jgi:hypothetical protein
MILREKRRTMKNHQSRPLYSIKESKSLKEVVQFCPYNTVL